MTLPVIRPDEYAERLPHIPRDGEYETAGEALLDRELEKETRAGVVHFKPGQHHAAYHGWHQDYFTGKPMEVARLTYVDAMGHACVVVCVAEPGRSWRASWVGRAGQVTAERERQVDDFPLSNKMLLALQVAREASNQESRPE